MGKMPYFNDTYISDAAGTVLQSVPPGVEGLALSDVNPSLLSLFIFLDKSHRNTCYNKRSYRCKDFWNEEQLWPGVFSSASSMSWIYGGPMWYSMPGLARTGRRPVFGMPPSGKKPKGLGMMPSAARSIRGWRIPPSRPY